MTLTLRKRSLWRRLIAVVAVAAVVLISVGCTPEQLAVRDLVNASRRQAGLAELPIDVNANAKAQPWAEHLARIGRLEHSNLAEGMPPGWQKLGENVGRGPSLQAIQDAFMRSPGHRANILDPAWNSVGAGVAVAPDGTVYVVQLFARY
ncbi:MAG TPA: CAP domain-containing protein [Acidimicrobiales bacterium]